MSYIDVQRILYKYISHRKEGKKKKQKKYKKKGPLSTQASSLNSQFKNNIKKNKAISGKQLPIIELPKVWSEC